MKKAFLLSGIVVLLFLSSCSHSTCPTYDNSSSQDRYSGGKKSKSSQGLFPKSMQ